MFTSIAELGKKSFQGTAENLLDESKRVDDTNVASNSGEESNSEIGVKMQTGKVTFQYISQSVKLYY